jgi:hypothetical protein
MRALQLPVASWGIWAFALLFSFSFVQSGCSSSDGGDNGSGKNGGDNNNPGVGAGSLPEDGIFSSPGGGSTDLGDGTSAIPEDGIFGAPKATGAEANGDDWTDDDAGASDDDSATIGDDSAPVGDDDAVPPGDDDSSFEDDDSTGIIEPGETEPTNSAECCQADNPCYLNYNMACDCGGYFVWDIFDCSEAPSYTEAQDSGSPQCQCSDGEVCVGMEQQMIDVCLASCADLAECATGCCADVEGIGAFCAPTEACAAQNCCGGLDACGWADNGFCDCGGMQAWDDVDCVDKARPARGDCCRLEDTCGLKANGVCDCGGLAQFETDDCPVPAVDEACAEGETQLENSETGDLICAAPCEKHEECASGCCAVVLQEGGSYCLPDWACEK